MFKAALVLVIAFTAFAANAEVYKCKGDDGKIQFSDTPCKANSTSQIVPDRMPVTAEQQADAQQRSQRMQNAVAAKDSEKAANRGAEQRTLPPSPIAPIDSETAATGQSDSEAMNRCVNDVQRQGASERVKAEMIASCRTAGQNQRSSGLTTDLVNDCVRNVERTGASGREKARQLALCHGGEVEPRDHHANLQNRPIPVATQNGCSGASAAPCPVKPPQDSPPALEKKGKAARSSIDG